MKRKLENGFITSMRVEKSVRELCEAMGISVSDAFMAGSELLINYHLKQGRVGKSTPDQIKEYFEYQARHIDELRDIVRSFDHLQKKLDLIEKAVEESLKPPKMIRVYAKDVEKTIEIPEDQFDPEWHTRRKT